MIKCPPTVICRSLLKYLGVETWDIGIVYRGLKITMVKCNYSH